MTENEETAIRVAREKRSVNEWINDIIGTVNNLGDEGNLLLDGDGRPGYEAGIEDPGQRERIKFVQATIVQMTTALDKSDETTGVFL